MGKEFFAERARFTFRPPFTSWAEEDFDILTTMINDTIQCEAGKTAMFYFFLPDLDYADGTFVLVIYRDEYVKQNPKIFALKKKQVKDIEETLPDDFNHVMFLLLNKISEGLCKLGVETTYELISINEEGDEYVAAAAGCTWDPSDDDGEDGEDGEDDDGDPNITDFPEYESYSIGDSDGDGDDEDSNI